MTEQLKVIGVSTTMTSPDAREKSEDQCSNDEAFTGIGSAKNIPRLSRRLSFAEHLADPGGANGARRFEARVTELERAANRKAGGR